MPGTGMGLGLHKPNNTRSNQTPILDVYPGAVAAYSLRYLTSSHTGDVILVRRGSDNAEMGFTPIEITDGTLLSWVGASSGNVKRWYDQSGNGNDLTQSFINNEPQIVTSGVLNTLNGKPILNGIAGNNDGLVSTLAGNATMWFFSIAQARSSESSFLLADAALNNQTILLSQSGGTGSGLGSLVSPTYYLNGSVWNPANSGAVYTAMQVQSLVAGTGDSSGFVNGYSTDYASSGASAMNYQEIIIYHSDESANRSAIETAINSYYSIY